MRATGLRRAGRALLHWLQPVRKEIARLEALAEAANDEMYDASRHRAKECYEDAMSFLAEAIALAEKVRLRRVAARLKARRDHIYNVYNHQFRYVGR